MLFWRPLTDRDFDLLNRLDADLSLLERAHFFRRFHVPVQSRDRWHNFASMLADCFVHEATKVDPKTKWGVSAEGPAVRFVASIVPEITGEHPTNGAVRQHLNCRRRKKSTTGAMRAPRIFYKRSLLIVPRAEPAEGH